MRVWGYLTLLPCASRSFFYFKYTTLDIEKAFGPWPNYVIANIVIALVWFKSIEFITKNIRLTHT
jgi:hypothetical protein